MDGIRSVFTTSTTRLEEEEVKEYLKDGLTYLTFGEDGYILLGRLLYHPNTQRMGGRRKFSVTQEKGGRKEKRRGSER